MTGTVTGKPVQKSITVKASAARAFELFTAEMDSWWPRSHHIGKSPMTKVIVEGRVNGRVYSEQQDGTNCQWGSILVWDPPHRFVMSWQITPQWQYEPEVTKSSEVEVRFTSESDGSTRVDLEHRLFERHGAGSDAMRAAVDSPGGWNSILQLFASRAEQVES